MARKKTCSKCNRELEPNRAGKFRYCRKCHAAYMRKNRKHYSQLTEQQRLKDKARSYLNAYLKRGLITKRNCSVCGNEIVEAHHPDYSKPLQVIWLCRKHHLELHKNNDPRGSFPQINTSQLLTTKTSTNHEN